MQVTQLFLLGDGALLHLEQALRHAPMLGQLLALSIANVAQEPLISSSLSMV